MLDSNDKDIAPKNAKLAWDDKGEKKEFILDKAVEISIGRDKNRDITLSDQKVSKLHAIVAWSENGFTIADQGSSNGTFVNNKKIKGPVTLQNGDQISIGFTNLKFVSVAVSPVEDLKTRIFPREIEPAAPKEAGKPEEAVEHMETKIFAVASPEAAEKEKPSLPIETVPGLKETPSLADGLSSLLDQIKATRETAEKLRDEEGKARARLISIVSNLNSIASGLGAIVDQTVELEQKVAEVELIKMLDGLSKNSSNVNLLVELAGNAALIDSLAKTISAHAKKLSEIRQALTDELANLNNN